MKYKVRIEDDRQTQWFEYPLKSKNIQVLLKYLPENEINRIQSKSKTWSFRKHQKVGDTDLPKMKKNVIKSALVDIKEATSADLQLLLQPGVILEILEGDGNKPLIFDSESKDILMEYCNDDFSDFILDKCRELEEFVGEVKKEEIENLKPGSSTKKVPTT
jgi:hypothetical protein